MGGISFAAISRLRDAGIHLHLEAFFRGLSRAAKFSFRRHSFFGTLQTAAITLISLLNSGGVDLLV